MPRVIPWGLILVAVMIVAAACSSGGDGATEACVGLADRWVFLQQHLLDGLDSSGELDPVETRNNAAAMLEQARDAEARGCTAEVAVGSPLICERLDQL